MNTTAPLSLGLAMALAALPANSSCHKCGAPEGTRSDLKSAPDTFAGYNVGTPSDPDEQQTVGILMTGTGNVTID